MSVHRWEYIIGIIDEYTYEVLIKQAIVIEDIGIDNEILMLLNVLIRRWDLEVNSSLGEQGNRCILLELLWRHGTLTASNIQFESSMSWKAKFSIWQF